MLRKFQHYHCILAKNESGQALVEYALIILFIVLLAVVAVQLFGENLAGYYDWIINRFPASP